MAFGNSPSPQRAPVARDNGAFVPNPRIARHWETFKSFAAGA